MWYWLLFMIYAAYASDTDPMDTCSSDDESYYLHDGLHGNKIYHDFNYFAVVNDNGVHEIPLCMVDKGIRYVEPPLLNDYIKSGALYLEAKRCVSDETMYTIYVWQCRKRSKTV